jgi:hypothetical protein
MVAIAQADDGIGSFFNAFHQIGIEKNDLTIETGELNHGGRWRRLFPEEVCQGCPGLSPCRPRWHLKKKMGSHYPLISLKAICPGNLCQGNHYTKLLKKWPLPRFPKAPKMIRRSLIMRVQGDRQEVVPGRSFENPLSLTGLFRYPAGPKGAAVFDRRR